MFTGIVEDIGTVAALDDRGDSARLRLATARVTDATRGESVAVNGCCLTVADLHADGFTADVMRETLTRTSVGDLVAGDRVNLERALPAEGRFGGHIVQGHVDGTGTLVRRSPCSQWDDVEIDAPPALLRYVVPQGSIAVDGVSLTVVDVTAHGFSVGLIPETLARTVLGTKQPGERVNLEVDVLAKYVEKLVHEGARPCTS